MSMRKDSLDIYMARFYLTTGQLYNDSFQYWYFFTGLNSHQHLHHTVQCFSINIKNNFKVSVRFQFVSTFLKYFLYCF